MPLVLNRRLRGLLAMGIILGAGALTLAIVELDKLEHLVSGAPQSTYPPPTPTTSTSPPIRPLDPGPSTIDDLLTQLSRTREKDLRTLLEHLDGHAERLKLTNQQVDRVAEELTRIESSDPYQEMEWKLKVPHDPERGYLVFVNRRAATSAIEVLGFRKLANPLRELPLEERVARVLEFVEAQVELDGDKHHAASWFSGELWRIGKQAVPFILQRAEVTPDFRRRYVEILSQIGDPRGVPFIVRALRDTPVGDTNARCDIIRRLSEINDPLTVETLVEAVQDEKRILVAAGYPPQQRSLQSRPGHTVWIYPVRECAAKGLSRTTGKNWSPLFQFDPRTWKDWAAASDKGAFDPMASSRSADELSQLLENLAYDRLRSPAGHIGWNDPSVFRDLGRQLKTLGPKSVPALVQVYRAIPVEFPIWEPELHAWTSQLLMAIGTPQALEAAKAIEVY